MNQTTPRVMMLIDADNVTTDVIEQALPLVMQRHGAIHVRRAYCTAELALKHLKLFKAHSIRPIVNVSTGKNSTDIALAVDAMDLVVAERPDLVVIVSSDSDFAPLVIRLREKGCRVEGIGQEGKTGEDSKPVYDAFIDIPHRKGKAAVTRAAPAKRGVRGAATGRSARAAVDKASTPEPELVFPPVEVPAAPSPARKRASPRRAAAADAAADRAEAAATALALAPSAAPSPLPEQPEAAPAPAPRKRAAKVASRSSRATATAGGSVAAPAAAQATPPLAAATAVTAPVPAPARRERQPRAPKLAQKLAPAPAQTPAQKPAQRAPAAQGPRLVQPPPAQRNEQAPRQRQRDPAPRPAPAPSLPEEVARILAALPELQSGARLQLNLAKERLCNAGLLAKSAPSTKLFRKHPRLFVLTPEGAPNKVQFLRPTAE